jgi:hypothetical protein
MPRRSRPGHAPGELVAQTPQRRTAAAGGAGPATYFRALRLAAQARKSAWIGADRRSDQGVDRSANRRTDLNIALATSFGRGEPFDTPIGP